MSSIINEEIKRIIGVAEQNNGKLNEEQAFNYLTCAILCYHTLEYKQIWFDLENQNITDGSNDGGIDFVFFDDDNSKVIIGQNKFSEKIDVNNARAEIEKISNTLKNFKENRTSSFNKKLKERLNNVIDRLNEENEGNIEIVFSSLAKFNHKKVIEEFESDSQYSDLVFYNTEDIEKMIEDLQSEQEVVESFSFKIDKAKNVLKYESDNFDGVVLNISASSLKKAYDIYESKGLFNLNIRRFIKAKNVDEGITYSIVKNKEDFWFKNNGLTIACKDYSLDGNTVKIYGFSIVNGGQTTTLIAKNFKGDSEDFYVLCKVVKKIEEERKNDKKDTMNFFNEIAEATNSQKPIQPRDLKANAPEMIQLQKLLKNRGIYLEIKRGVSGDKQYKNNRIKNEILAQVYYAFVEQKPGTARSNKKSLFSNNSIYKKIFQKKYGKNSENLNFLVDLIALNKYVDDAIQNFKNKTAYTALNLDELNVLNNAKLAIIALMGYIYRLVNEDSDITSQNIENDLGDFIFGGFISNYKHDDVHKLVEQLIYELVEHIDELYKSAFENGQVSSISNFLKTDKTYLQHILLKYISELKKRDNFRRLENYYGDLFRRK